MSRRCSYCGRVEYRHKKSMDSVLCECCGYCQICKLIANEHSSDTRDEPKSAVKLESYEDIFAHWGDSSERAKKRKGYQDEDSSD